MIFDARILAMRIKKQRNKRNMTQEHLAEIANLSVVFISNVERAKRVPSLEKMIDICNALECTMDELLDGFIAAKTSSAHSQLDSLIACTTPMNWTIPLNRFMASPGVSPTSSNTPNRIHTIGCLKRKRYSIRGRKLREI